jgi:hypothetical protein
MSIYKSSDIWLLFSSVSKLEDQHSTNTPQDQMQMDAATRGGEGHPSRDLPQSWHRRIMHLLLLVAARHISARASVRRRPAG